EPGGRDGRIRQERGQARFVGGDVRRLGGRRRGGRDGCGWLGGGLFRWLDLGRAGGAGGVLGGDGRLGHDGGDIAVVCRVVIVIIAQEHPAGHDEDADEDNGEGADHAGDDRASASLARRREVERAVVVVGAWRGDEGTRVVALRVGLGVEVGGASLLRVLWWGRAALSLAGLPGLLPALGLSRSLRSWLHRVSTQILTGRSRVPWRRHRVMAVRTLAPNGV